MAFREAENMDLKIKPYSEAKKFGFWDSEWSLFLAHSYNFLFTT